MLAKVKYYLVSFLVVLPIIISGCNTESGSSSNPVSQKKKTAFIEPSPFTDTYTYEASQGNPVTLALDPTIFYVKFVDGTTEDDINALLGIYGLSPTQRWQVPCTELCIVDVPEGADPRDFFVDFATRDPARFGEEALVEYATPIYYNRDIFPSPELAAQEMILKTGIIIRFDHVISPGEGKEFLDKYKLLRDPLDFDDDPFLAARLTDPKSWSVLDAVELFKTFKEVVWVAPSWWFLGPLSQ